MIYLPVQFYALCPVLSGVISPFSTKCFIIALIKWPESNCRLTLGRWNNCIETSEKSRSLVRLSLSLSLSLSVSLIFSWSFFHKHALWYVRPLNSCHYVFNVSSRRCYCKKDNWNGLPAFAHM